jgi:uncharacterized protein (TIGR03086 family)
MSHLISGNHGFASILSGPPADAFQRRRPDEGDVLGSYRESAAALLAAFARPGVLGEIVIVPLGPVPGIVALHLRMTEALVHGWDIARATGQPTAFPQDLAEQELAFSRDQLVAIPVERRPFAAPQPVAADAPAIDRLAACLGRQVTTPTASTPGPATADPGPLVAGIGNRVHIFARPHRRAELQWCFETALGCARVTPVTHPGMAEPMLVVSFTGGGNLSIEFTDNAPDDDNPRLGAWLELRTQDPARMMRTALEAGLSEVKHPGHPYYFMAPGGQVFTIAPTP